MKINGHNIPEPYNLGEWYEGWENDYWRPYTVAARKVIDKVADEYYLSETDRWACFINLPTFIRHNKSCKEAKLWVELYEDYSSHFYIQDVEKEEICLLLNVLTPDLRNGRMIYKEQKDWMDKVKDKRVPFKNFDKIISITDYA